MSWQIGAASRLPCARPQRPVLDGKSTGLSAATALGGALFSPRGKSSGSAFLGFRAVLTESEAEAANGALSVHAISDVERYTIDSLSSKRRNDLRRCYRRAVIVEIIGPALLRQQGYEVFESALNRTGYARPGSKEDYLVGLEQYFAARRRVVLGALINDRLAGYLGGFAVDGNAYIEQVHLFTEALPHEIGIGLVFEFAQVCRRSKGIRKIIYGQHSREDKSLCTFKERIGFPVTLFPTRVRLLPVVAQLLRWRYPHKYYRLTGRA